MTTYTKDGVEVAYTGKDQNWQNQETVYWFELNGQVRNIDLEFNGEKFGVVESGNDAPRAVDSEGAPIDGLFVLMFVEHLLDGAVTDEMRAE